MNVAIVGLGLIGGSIAKALKKYTPEHSVWAIESDEATASKALVEGAIDKTVSASQLRFADLTVVALHPEATVEFLESNSGAFAAGNTVIDVCGVKKEIVSRVSRLFGKGVNYVGCHPMAGKEYSGYDYSEADLFRGASFIITVLPDTNEAAVELLKNLAARLGFKESVVCSPEKHDGIIAFSSQLAHVVSNCYIKSPTLDSAKGFSAGSFQDLTRVARMNAAMWTELFLMNSEALCFEIDTLINNMLAVRRATAAGDAQKLYALLQEGSRLKTDCAIKE